MTINRVNKTVEVEAELDAELELNLELEKEEHEEEDEGTEEDQEDGMVNVLDEEEEIEKEEKSGEKEISGKDTEQLVEAELADKAEEQKQANHKSEPEFPEFPDSPPTPQVRRSNRPRKDNLKYKDNPTVKLVKDPQPTINREDGVQSTKQSSQRVDEQSNKTEKSDEDIELHCTCREPYIEGEKMMQCSANACEEWFHPECVVCEYICNSCNDKEKQQQILKLENQTDEIVKLKSECKESKKAKESLISEVDQLKCRMKELEKENEKLGKKSTNNQESSRVKLEQKTAEITKLKK